MEFQLVRDKKLVSTNVSFTEIGKTSPNVPSNLASQSKPAKTKNALESVGSALGSLLGGTKRVNKPAADAGKEPTPVKSDVVSAKTPAKPSSSVIPAGAEDDGLAFGDDEPVSQAIFDSSPVEAPSVERTLPQDPPSAKKMAPPAETPVSVEASKNGDLGKSVEELQAEIKRLKKELKPPRKRCSSQNVPERTTAAQSAFEHAGR